MNETDFTNTELYQQVQRISQLKDLNIQANGYKWIIQYMNAYCLTQFLHVDMDDFSIENIIGQYEIYNEDLLSITLDIFGDIECFDDDIDDNYIELCLNYIETNYKIIQSNYGDIVFDKNLDFCQNYFEYINYLELKDHWIFEIEKFINYTPDDNWEDYYVTRSLITSYMDDYNHTDSPEQRKRFIHFMLKILDYFYK